ncbi:predicted protein [Plenodomus lingam JN3]|uniref:Predicted protein n=1 Tax=Leptosphaeria maculans (strain JN3 / isolate v23.1.3 / race Av1-4-5-6-7-8) TaxID=985895 RepID=E4ZI98_LEPMJ|nr:predicted protein [Plenodomus lingam JN3]CBX90759.1 predicted protein [Plenodomus lingam JN3]
MPLSGDGPFNSFTRSVVRVRQLYPARRAGTKAGYRDWNPGPNPILNFPIARLLTDSGHLRDNGIFQACPPSIFTLGDSGRRECSY